MQTHLNLLQVDKLTWAQNALAQARDNHSLFQLPLLFLNSYTKSHLEFPSAPLPVLFTDTHSNIQLFQSKQLMIHLHRPEQPVCSLHEFQCPWREKENNKECPENIKGEQVFANTAPCTLLQHLGSVDRVFGTWYRLWLIAEDTVSVLGRTASLYQQSGSSIHFLYCFWKQTKSLQVQRHIYAVV